ncbi:calcium-binding protein [Chachezhania sediminis]|uniref:calcium-binding protein n=1 Tax=Chachezhania sediminis TaxID=2599291 RepID=UPI00131A68E8|nr:calcium-binding protein [Chachezhania sediminis]
MTYAAWASGAPDDFGADETALQYFSLTPANALEGTWNNAPVDGTPPALAQSFVVEFDSPNPPVPNVIRGNNRPNDLIGTSGQDAIYGYGGNGNDRLFGGKGRDVFLGGKGADLAKGQAGNDTLEGQRGKDTLFGNTGNDTIVGGTGNDTIVGGTGKHTLYGGAGKDTFVYNDLKEGRDQIGAFQVGIDALDLDRGMSITRIRLIDDDPDHAYTKVVLSSGTVIELLDLTQHVTAQDLLI